MTLTYLSVPTLEWYVESGTTLTYRIQVTGYTSLGNPLNISERGSPPFCHVNNSQVTIQVVSLPDMPLHFDGESFSESVLEVAKTTLASPMSYDNGSAVVDPPNDVLNDLVSHCLLPTGGWSHLDMLYPDEPDFEFACDTYLSKLETGGFMIGHRYFNIDAGMGWHGTVSLETGIPLSAEIWECKYYGNEWFSYKIILTLVQD